MRNDGRLQSYHWLFPGNSCLHLFRDLDVFGEPFVSGESSDGGVVAATISGRDELCSVLGETTQEWHFERAGG